MMSMRGSPRRAWTRWFRPERRSLQPSDSAAMKELGSTLMPAELSEEGKVDGLGHGAVACGVGVEVVAAVEGGEEMGGVGGVGGGPVEVDDGVEVAGGADPGVEFLAVGFAGGAGVVVVGAGVGRDGGAVDPEIVGVGAGDDLLVGADHTVDEGVAEGLGVGGSYGVGGVGEIALEAAEVVDAFEEDDVADGGLGEDVAVEAGEGVGAEAVGEEVVAADALVEDAGGMGCGVGLEALGEDVGPAVVAVEGGGGAVGDGVAEGNDGEGGGGGLDVDGGDEVPVVDLSWRRGGRRRR